MLFVSVFSVVYVENKDEYLLIINYVKYPEVTNPISIKPLELTFKFFDVRTEEWILSKLRINKIIYFSVNSTEFGIILF